MTATPPEDTFRELLDRLDERDFAGRAFELSLFREKLRRESPGSERIVNLYGPGGIGKTALLARFRGIAAEAGASYAVADLRDAAGSPALLCRELARQLGLADGPDDADALADGLRRLTAGGRAAALAFDRYEEAGALDEWLRVRLLPRLPAETLVVFAGRYPLGGPWSSAGWRRLTIPLPLGELEYADVREYASRLRLGQAEAEWADRLWIHSAGYPLSLSLLAQLAVAKRPIGAASLRLAERREPFDELLARWLDEAPADDLRPLLYAAAIPRSFDLALLRDVAERDWPDALFERLLRLSFVRRGERGWQMHDLVREHVRRALREREPESYEAYAGRAVRKLRARADAKLAQGAPAARVLSELLSLIGHPILRAHFRQSRATDHYWETAATDAALAEAERYIAGRLAHARPCTIACADPETAAVFRYELSADDGVVRLRGWDARELYAAAPGALRLLRGPEGDVRGLAAVLPLTPDALALLRRWPATAPAIAELPPEKAAGGGQYVVALDVADLERIELRSALVHLQFELALAGGLLLSAPPPAAYFRDAHEANGYVPIRGRGSEARLYEIDARTPTGMQAYLDRIMQRPAAPATPDAAPSAASPNPDAERAPYAFTPREKEVAALLVRGATNPIIAATMFVSEAAVKKHVNAMLQKTGCANRTQLAALLLERPQMWR